MLRVNESDDPPLKRDPSRRHAVLAGLMLLVFGALISSCSAATTAFPSDAIAIRANSDIGTGKARLLVGVAKLDGTRLGSPDERIQIEVAPDDDPSASQRAPAVFTWIVPDVVGLYRAEFDFQQPGIWQAIVIPESGSPLEPIPFQVFDDTAAPNVGDAAPPAPSLTLADGPIEEITTDPQPDPQLYRLSLDDALGNGRNTVVVFSTPAFCETAACGPMLETVKDIATDYPKVDFVHVEVYTGFNEPDFAIDADHLAPAVSPAFWNLPSEPWVFVVDGTGLVTGRFEGVVDADELHALLPPSL